MACGTASITLESGHPLLALSVGFLHLHQQHKEEQHQQEQQQEQHVCSMVNHGEYALSKGEERIGMHTPAELGKSTSRHILIHTYIP